MEFETGLLARKNAVLKHHGLSPSVQQRFFAHTKSLVIAFQKAGNPFYEYMPDNIARSVMGVHRLQSTSVAFHAPIKMNKIQLPGNRHKYRNKSKHVNSTNEDNHLLRQLYMTMCVRERNSDRLFEVENADCPPSLSKHGILRSDQKSDLLFCLEVECSSDFEEADAKLIDGAHMVHFLGRMRASSHSVTMPIRR